MSYNFKVISERDHFRLITCVRAEIIEMKKSLWVIFKITCDTF